MSCEYIRISELYLWITIEQEFSNDDFFNILELSSGIKVVDVNTTHSCMGPLELTQVVSTNMGVFTIERVFEGLIEDCGTAIYSDCKALMELVFLGLKSNIEFNEKISNEEN